MQGRTHEEQNKATPAKPWWQVALSRVTFHRQDQAVLGFEPSAQSYQHRPAVTTASWPRALPSVQIWAGAPCRLPACCATDGKSVPQACTGPVPRRHLRQGSWVQLLPLTIAHMSGLGSVAPSSRKPSRPFKPDSEHALCFPHLSPDHPACAFSIVPQQFCLPLPQSCPCGATSAVTVQGHLHHSCASSAGQRRAAQSGESLDE